MHEFVRNLMTEWRRLKLPATHGTVVIAVSGGADSLSLLLALADLRERGKLDLRLVAAHYNHNFRGRESDADEEFVKRIAAERNYELAVGRAPVSKDGNLEQNARRLRYQFLVETGQRLHASCIVTAHTLNDQAETFLLNLIRGSGPDGLSGMRAVREMRPESGDDRQEGDISLPFPEPRPTLARPLLSWARREDTEDFCRGSGVDFRYDTMNDDMSFKRVRVRKMLLPMLRDFNPRIIETLARTAELMHTSARPVLHDPLPEQLQIRELVRLDTADMRRTLRSWLASRRGSLRSIGLKHIEAIEGLVRSTKSGRTVEIPGFGAVRKHAGRLRYENIKVDK